MATKTSRARSSETAVMPPLYRFTVEQYERMGETGVLEEHERVELIEGVIYQMAAIGNRHARCVNRLNAEITHQAYGRATVSPQNPVRLPPRSMPQPDLVVALLDSTGAPRGIPSPENTLLVIEVADSSLAYDLRIKAALYAANQVPELWVWDVVHRRVHVFRELVDGAYQVHLIAQPEDELEIVLLPGVRVSVGQILGPEDDISGQ